MSSKQQHMNGLLSKSCPPVLYASNEIAVLNYLYQTATH